MPTQPIPSAFAFPPPIQTGAFPGSLAPVGAVFANTSVTGISRKPAEVLVKGAGFLMHPDQYRSSSPKHVTDGEFIEIVRENGDEA